MFNASKRSQSLVNGVREAIHGNSTGAPLDAGVECLRPQLCPGLRGDPSRKMQALLPERTTAKQQ